MAIGAIHNNGNSSNSVHIHVYAYIGESWLNVGDYIDEERAHDMLANYFAIYIYCKNVAVSAISNY